MANRAFINEEGLGEMVLEGVVDKTVLFQVLQEMLQVDNELSSAGKAIKTLVNVAGLEKLDAGAEELSKLSLTHRLYDKVAVCGANDAVKEQILHILSVVTEASKVRYFPTRQEAITWLKG